MNNSWKTTDELLAVACWVVGEVPGGPITAASGTFCTTVVVECAREAGPQIDHASTASAAMLLALVVPWRKVVAALGLHAIVKRNSGDRGTVKSQATTDRRVAKSSGKKRFGSLLLLFFDTGSHGRKLLADGLRNGRSEPHWKCFLGDAISTSVQYKSLYTIPEEIFKNFCRILTDIRKELVLNTLQLR